MTISKSVTDDIMLCYMTLLLSGHTINHMKIMCGTIKVYMYVINAHYKRMVGVTVFNARGDVPAAVLLCSQESFEKGPDQQAPLTEHMIEQMQELTKGDPLGFKACV